MKYLYPSLLTTLLFGDLRAQSDAALTQELKLYPGEKASVQWERVFSSDRRLKRHHLDSLSKEERKKLKVYMLRHSADSEQPIIREL